MDAYSEEATLNTEKTSEEYILDAKKQIKMWSHHYRLIQKEIRSEIL